MMYQTIFLEKPLSTIVLLGRATGHGRIMQMLRHSMQMNGYLVDYLSDKVTEATDTVEASVTHTLSEHVEHLRLTGKSAINGTGNDLDNEISGNDGNNILDDKAGNDFLYGRRGRDTLIGGAGRDQFVFKAATETSTSKTNCDVRRACGFPH
jgi:hypothetical protein